MESMSKRLRLLSDDELLALSEAIDIELERRMDFADEIPDSARRRAVLRQQSYRRAVGSHAPPVSATGLGKHRRRAA